MTPEESIKKQLDQKRPFIKIRSDDFCKLAKKVEPNAESENDVERSMARTLELRDGKHVDTLNVHPKVAQLLLRPATKATGGTGTGDKQPSGKDGSK